MLPPKILVISREPPKDLPEGCMMVPPGTAMPGRGFDVIIDDSAPRTPEEEEWFQHVTHTRLYPRGVVLL